MKTVNDPRAVFYFRGRLVEVIGINEGHRSIYLRYVKTEDMPKCEHCGAPQDIQFDVIESSLNFQTGAKAVPTIEGDKPMKWGGGSEQ